MIANLDKPAPVFGILTMPDENKKFRGNRKNFIDIIRAGHEKGVHVYVITVPDLKLKQPYINGYRYDLTRGVWTSQLIPRPKVIYNRIPFREDEIRNDVRQLIRNCRKHPDIHLFNPAFFNKWRLVEWLRRSNTSRKYIPATRRWSSSLKLKPIMQKHSLLYLKPERGKAGHGIMKVQYINNQPPPTYKLTIQNNKKSHTISFSKLAQLREKIKEKIGDEKYIVQQGIYLAKYKNRPFDLRVLVQKNIQGVWTITGIGARVAGSLSITTHVPRGGSIENPEKLLANVFGPHTAKRIILRTRKAALTIAKQIERKAGSRLGEMSMDLGVDRKGNIWFFEANSKPMKFDEAEIRIRSLHKLIDYGLYLYNRRKVVAKKRR